MRLAAHLGKTRAELLAQTDSAELSDWMAFDQEYGLPDLYFLAAVLGPAVTLGQVKKPLSGADFVPYFRAGAGAGKRGQTPEEMMGVMRDVRVRGKGGDRV